MSKKEMSKKDANSAKIMNREARQIAARHFFESAFKEFSLYDNVRSIPAIQDGLKPAQRKAIYGTLARGENAGLLSVERLSAYIAAATDYHHGIGSMQGTIVGLANNYPGANNANIFVPEGQFGSRLTPDSAAPRYIETKLSEYFRLFFPKADDGILEHLEVDGEKIEPKVYAPIIPMVLVNGSVGTGTGHASLILSYNPNEIRDACLKVLSGKKLKAGTLVPWYRGFSGKIDRNQETGQISISGNLEVINSTTIKITELPIGMYLDDFKSVLHKLEEQGIIKDYDIGKTDETRFDFTVQVPRSTTAMDTEELYKRFKLIARDTENYTLWNTQGHLQRFDSAEAIIEEFVAWRTGMYEKRRQKLIADTREAIRWISEKLRFILFYLDNVTAFKNKKKDDLIALLLKNKFEDYDRLLAMQIWTLTRDKIEELKKEIGDKKITLQALEEDTAEKMYARELKEFKYQ
jgi:DNA topoisomerase-2